MFNLGIPPQKINYELWQKNFDNCDIIGTSEDGYVFFHYYYKNRNKGDGAEGICVSYDDAANTNFDFITDSEVLFYAKENICKIKLKKL